MSGNSLDVGLLTLRLGTSAMMMTHGAKKAGQLLEGNFDFPDPLGMGPAVTLILAVLTEFVCAFLVALGIKVKLTAIPVCITMLVAAFVFHKDDPFAKKEFALLYAIPYLALAMTGGGSYTLESFFSKRR